MIKNTNPVTMLTEDSIEVVTPIETKNGKLKGVESFKETHKDLDNGFEKSISKSSISYDTNTSKDKKDDIEKLIKDDIKNIDSKIDSCVNIGKLKEMMDKIFSFSK